MAALGLSERTLTPLRIAGLGLALGGLWLIFGQPWPGDGRATLGTAAVVAGMTVQALGLVWIKRLNLRASALAITTGSLGVAGPGFVLAWVAGDAARPPPAPGGRKTSHSPASARLRPARRIGVSVRSPSHSAANTPVTSGDSPKMTEISPAGICSAPH